MDALLRAFASQGFKTDAEEQEGRVCARTIVLGERFELLLREKLRQRPFDASLDAARFSEFLRPKVVSDPTGSFLLEVRCLGSHYSIASWKDRKRKSLEQQLDEVLTYVVRHVQHVRDAREEKKRLERERWEAEQARWRAEEARKLEQLRVDILLQRASSWHRASQLRDFLQACRAAATPTTGVYEWLRWAEGVANRLDPLTKGVEAVRSATQ